jgi:Ca-activated chloride channel homolog
MADLDTTRILAANEFMDPTAGAGNGANGASGAVFVPPSSSAESESVRFSCYQGSSVMVARTPLRDHLLFDILATAPPGQAGSRTPLNICLCLDRSGSMEGEALDYAKRACGYVVDLLEPQDVFSIVTFAETADVVMPARRVVNKALIKDYINRITVGNTTNLYDGLSFACNQIAAGKTPATLNRVLLLTDGDPTAGKKDFHSIISYVAEQKRSDVSITTLGFGPDYSEELVASVAKRSGGNYYYISRADLIPEVFRRELDVLMRTAARNLRIKLTLSRGVAVRQVYGNDFRVSQRMAETDLIDLELGGSIGSLWEIEMVPHPGGMFRVAKAQITFDDAATGQTQTLACNVVKEFTTNESKVTDGVNLRVQAEVEIANAARQLDRTMRDVRTGRADPDLVVKDLQQTRTLLMSQGKMLLAQRIEQAILDIQRGDSVEKTLIGAIMKLDQGRLS